MTNTWRDDDFLQVIEKYDNFDEYASKVVEDILTSKSDILGVVEKLSPILTNSDVAIRCKGMEFYSSVINCLPKDYLTEKQLVFITAFYVDRLKDNHRVVPPVLVGILSLVKMVNLPKTSPGEMLMNIFKEVPCQQQVRVDRHHIYKIIHHSVLNFSDELKSLGPDFVYGVISSVDGERDPRNLILLFSILPTFLQLIPLGHLTEEMFEIIACYFPVDFTSPRDDPNAITRDDLADKLCPCLCGNPGFAEFCIPLLLEKLDSNLKIAKIDSLKLLKASCGVFPVKAYEENMSELLLSIQREISHKTEHELSNLATESLKDLVAKFYKCSSKPNAEGLVAEIIRSSQCLLVEATTKPMLDLPLKILLSAAKANKHAAIYITNQMVSILTTHYYLKNEDFIKISLLRWCSDLYKVCLNENSFEDVKKPFENLPKMYLTAINEHSVELKIEGFSGMSLMGKMMSQESYLVLCGNIDNNYNSKPLKSVCKKCITSLIRENPQHFSKYVEDKLKLDLSNVNINNHMDLLCTVGSERFYTKVVFDKFTEYLKSNNIILGTTLISVCSENFQNINIYDQISIQDIEIDQNFINHLLLWADNIGDNLNIRIIEEISILIKTIMKHLNSENQISILDKQLLKYCQVVFQQRKEIFIFIIEALLSSLKIENTDFDKIIDLVLESSLTFSLSVTNVQYHEKSCHLIANLLNKFCKTDNFQKQCILVDETIQKWFSNNNNVNKSNAVNLHCWFTKSLLLAGHQYSAVCLSKIFDLLSTESAMDAAKGIKLIMNDSQEALNSDCYCITNLFYKQKIFHVFLSHVNSLKPEDTSKFQRPAYHLTWAYILQFVPKSVLEMEIAKVSDVVIESLDFEDSELLTSSMETISYLMQKKNKTLLDSLQTVLPRCVKLGGYKKSMKVRIAALHCVFEMANNISTVNILPYKQDVIYKLSPYLDDPKRFVRNAAVKARTRWYLVGSPGEDKLSE